MGIYCYFESVKCVQKIQTGASFFRPHLSFSGGGNSEARNLVPFPIKCCGGAFNAVERCMQREDLKTHVLYYKIADGTEFLRDVESNVMCRTFDTVL